MLKSPSHALLGEEIRSILRQKKLTQTVLARALDISRPAVTQMLAGEINLSAARFEQIVEFLNPAPEIRTKLEKLYRQANRSLTPETTIPESFHFLLQQRELSLPMLSNRTGISVEKLNLLAGGVDPMLDPETNLRLQKTLNLHSPAINYEAEYDFPTKLFDTGTYSLPLLHADDFDFFRKDMKLSDLAILKAQYNIFWDLGKVRSAAAIIAPCSVLQLTLPGFVLIAVCDPQPECKHQWELRYDINGRFGLFEKQGKNWEPLQFTDPAAIPEKTVWSLPVLDMAFKLFEPSVRKD